MTAHVKLSVVVEGMEFQPEESSSYLDTKTGELVVIGEEERSAAEDDRPLSGYPDWQREQIEAARQINEDTEDRFLPLPSKFDIHEYDIMDEFCSSIEDGEISDELSDAIRGSGAFRRFKEAIHHHGIADRWYEFRDDALKQIAIAWCESHGIEFEDDVRRDVRRRKQEKKSKKAKLYETVLVQVRGVMEGERNRVANAANVAALLFHTLPQVSWAGFYFVEGGELVVGPFQGKPACTRIAPGQGVCGKAAAERKTIVVPNVHEFPGHIACDEASNSEIVLPIIKDDRLIGVLDLDSTFLDRFDADDQFGLEAVVGAFVAMTE